MKQSLEYIYCKKGSREDVLVKPFVLNKFVSYFDIKLASMVDLGIFGRDEKITTEMLKFNLPRLYKIPFVSYLKKVEREEEFEFLFKKIRKYFQYSNRELNFMKQILLKDFKDKEILKQYFKFFGCEKKYYIEMEVDFENEKKKDEGVLRYM